MLRSREGAWVGWPGRAGRDGRAVRRGRAAAAPGAAVGQGGRGLLRGLLQRHAVAALPRRRRRRRRSTGTGGRPTCGSTSGSPRRRRRWPPRAPRSGSRTTSCSWCRPRCASCGRTCASGSSCTSRSRPPSCSCSCRGGRRIIEGLLGADLVGFHTPGGARNFRWLATRLTVRGGGPQRRRAGLPTAARSARARSRSRSTPATLDELSRSRGGAGAGQADPRRPGRPGASRCSAWTGSTTPRASTCGCARSRSCSSRSGSQRRHGDDPARHAQPGTRRALPEDAQRHRAGRRAHQRRRTPGSAIRSLHYLHQSLPRDELAAFFVAADVMLVTPLRDGMNLVAKEYVACRHDDAGVLVLSEFAGAAIELQDALLVNPHDTDGVKHALLTALTMMPDDEAGEADADPAPAGAEPRRRPVGPHVPRRARVCPLRKATMTDLDEALRPARGRPATARRPGLRRGARPDRRRAVAGPAAARGGVRARACWPTLPGTTVALLSGPGAGRSRGRLRVRGADPAGRQPRRGVRRRRARARRRGPRAAGPARRRGHANWSAASRGCGWSTSPPAWPCTFASADPEVAERVLDAVRGGPGRGVGGRGHAGQGGARPGGARTCRKGRRSTGCAARCDADAVLFAGDDVTDETAFARLRAGDVGRQGRATATPRPRTGWPIRRRWQGC